MGKRRSRIGFLTHGIWDSFGRELWKGAVCAAREADVDIIFFVCSNTNTRRDTFQAGANMVFDLADSGNCDGFVVSASSLSHFVSEEKLTAFYARYGAWPLVTISPVKDDVPAVSIDNYAGIYTMAEHLIKAHGRRRLLFLPGPLNNNEVQERQRAFRDALRDHDLPYGPEYIAPPGDWTYQTGRKNIAAVIEAGKIEFDAVIAANDGMAVGVVEELTARGVCVPVQVSVAGFNDSAEALFVEPPITSVRQPVFEVGRCATRLAAAKIRGEAIPLRTVLPVGLVTRKSCGCLMRGVSAITRPIKKTKQGTLRERIAAERRSLAARLRKLLSSRYGLTEPGWTSRLIDALLREGEGKASGAFLASWSAGARKYLYSGGLIVNRIRPDNCSLRN